jgi:hypothetical protein
MLANFLGVLPILTPPLCYTLFIISGPLADSHAYTPTPNPTTYCYYTLIPSILPLSQLQLIAL